MTRNLPSGLKAAEVTGPVCLSSRSGSCLLSVHHTLTIPSSEAVTMRWPSGLKAAALNASPCGS